MAQVKLSKCLKPHPPPPLVDSIPPPASSMDSPSIKTLLTHLIANNSLPTTTTTSKKSQRNSKSYRCPYCFKILGRSKFPVHLACLHSDKLLSSYFPPPSSFLPPPSEEICRQVLTTKVVGPSKKIPSKTKRIRSGCHICGLSYSKNNQLKYHFLVTHTDKLCEEIKNFQSENLTIKVEKITTENPQPPQNLKSGNHLINIGEDISDKQLIKNKEKITHKNCKAVKIKRVGKSEDTKIHREKMEGKLKDKLEENTELYFGGDADVEGMEGEEDDVREFDVKPQMLDELIINEDDEDYLQQWNKLPDNQSASPVLSSRVVKMEVFN